MFFFCLKFVNFFFISTYTPVFFSTVINTWLSSFHRLTSVFFCRAITNICFSYHLMKNVFFTLFVFISTLNILSECMTHCSKCVKVYQTKMAIFVRFDDNILWNFEEFETVIKNYEIILWSQINPSQKLMHRHKPL